MSFLNYLSHKNSNWRRAFCLALVGLSASVLLTGCPEKADVKVSIKSAGGSGAAEGAGTGGDTTAAAGYGTFTGTVTFSGPANAPALLVGESGIKPEDRAVCSAKPILDESLLVNSQNKGLANVVVFLEKRPANIKPELAKPPTEPAFFDQKGCVFTPHVLVFQVGQPLLIVSDDEISHNTHTKPKRNNEFNQLISPKDRTGKPCEYKKSESGPLSVVCDLHSWMKAYHFPIDHPYWAKTDENGKFKIEGLPAGKHVFRVWHERGPGDSQLLDRKLQITIEVDKETVKELSYGPTNFAGLASPPRQTVAFEDLQKGGEITLTQRENKR